MKNPKMKNLTLTLILFNLLTNIIAGPLLSDKSFKATSSSLEDPKDKNVTIEESEITEEERQFIKEIEAKYNVKKEEEEESSSSSEEVKEDKNAPQAPLPAVIAIEIINDNSTDGKGKRTIDANLGYGYKTDRGYFYSRFGQGQQEQKGKFMIYPYSQHDIPPSTDNGKPYKYHTQILLHNKAKGERTQVEIQPSKAFQLVPVDSQDEHGGPNTYKLGGTVSQIRTRYEHVQAVQTPPPPQYQTPDYLHHGQQIPTTLYTTYNGGQVSGLSGHFPVVMPNYYVSPSQFLNHPQYQGLGLSNGDHETLPQKNIIPVLILRIPSSHIQNPTAELFPKLPHSNPYAMTLNNIDLQSLVNQYLASIQPQYEAPAPPAEPKYVYHYNQPATYYNPHQSLYTIPNDNSVQYVQPSGHYLPSNQPQYVHQAPINEAQQSIRYVIPHPSPSPDTHQSVSHTSFTQVYGPPKVHEQHYEQQEEHLPFSENYPDAAHTQVIYSPHYQESPQLHQVQSQAIHYAAPHAVNPNDLPFKPILHQGPHVRFPEPQAETSHNQIDAYEQTNEERADDDENKYPTPSPSKIPPHAPYNYHAHPYPKRQATLPAEETKKSMQHSRKVRTGV